MSERYVGPGAMVLSQPELTEANGPGKYVQIMVGVRRLKCVLPYEIIRSASGFVAKELERIEKEKWYSLALKPFARNHHPTVELVDVHYDDWQRYEAHLTHGTLKIGTHDIEAAADALKLACRLQDPGYVKHVVDQVPRLFDEQHPGLAVERSVGRIFDKLCAALAEATRNGMTVKPFGELLVKTFSAERIRVSEASCVRLQAQCDALDAARVEACAEVAEKQGQISELYELHTENRAANSRLETHLGTLRSKACSLQRQIASLKMERDNLAGRLKQSSSKCRDLASELADAQEKQLSSDVELETERQLRNHAETRAVTLSEKLAEVESELEKTSCTSVTMKRARIDGDAADETEEEAGVQPILFSGPRRADTCLDDPSADGASVAVPAVDADAASDRTDLLEEES
ncbi:hypothetical protein KC331_g394 [Hortaea werneckii]|nr:hypothetical protein KC361_g8657 [Hortaea werneckii]KAI6823144.1 hypothetical protein KC342_g12236 [Hortaea werneckii]KAI7345109.1 hypothetical protein KC320_g8491 [Hortaea werneckii]KAI7554663.1 hypothetical protein KC331_g394 [Hortaea werneckii]KAI7722570.1 hypothetical protein KC353_g391 [Hortaea werneckii]